MRVIGIDPSLTRTGLAVVDLDHAVKDWTWIRTKPNKNQGATEDLGQRLAELSEALTSYMQDHKGVVAIEAQVGAGFGHRNTGSVGKQMAAYGACIGASPSRPILIPSAEVKRRLTGRQGATKDEAWTAATENLEVEPDDPGAKVNREAVRDAVCVAVAARPDVERLRSMLPG